MIIVGNENAVSAADKLFSGERAPHGIVIYGDKGCGKKTLAKYIAAKLLCKNAVKPCGNCKSCNMIDDDCHPDFVMVKPSLASGAYRLEDLRNVVSDSVTAPNESDHTVYLIADLDKTPVGAQNTLLKLIEEPPQHVVIILTACSKEYFLPTVLSRVVSIGVAPVTKEQCGEYLTKNTKYKQGDIDKAVSSMGGNIGMCLEYLSGSTLRACCENAEEAALAIASGSEYQLLKALTDCGKSRETAETSLKLLENILRDAVMLGMGCEGKVLGSSEKAARKLAEKYSVKKLGGICTLPEKYLTGIKFNASLAAAMGSLCAEIKEITG